MKILLGALAIALLLGGAAVYVLDRAGAGEFGTAVTGGDPTESALPAPVVAVRATRQAEIGGVPVEVV